MVDFLHKILVPQRSANLIARDRLNDILATIASQRLITISGPAGYGKTSLLTDFASASPLPVCWYTLDSTDQDPWVFLDYLVASIEYRFPNSVAQTTMLLETQGRVSFATLIAALIRDCSAIEQGFIIVLDDWHVVDHCKEIHEIATRLALYCPHCHLILASRSYPSLPNMMLLTARRQMRSIDGHQLRFTAPEVATVLKVGYDIAISDEHATALAKQSDGWITGVLLLFQTHNLDRSEAILHTMSAQRQIYRYLTEEVFDQQPLDIQAFLLDSALLEEITPDSCDTIFCRHDTRRLLDQLLRQHLFISEIKPGVLRYHPLFREFPQEHYQIVDQQRYRAAMLQVAHFYMARSHVLLAFDRYTAAGDLAAAQRVLSAHGERLYMNGRLETLDRLFSAIPEDNLDAPLLCLLARIRLDLGHDAEAYLLANLAAARAQSGDQPTILLLQAQFARIDGRYGQALDLAQKVCAMTRNPAQLATALRTTAICHHRLDQIDTAIEELQEALSIEQQQGNSHAVALFQLDLGLCYRDTGLLSKASDYYQQSETYWVAIGNSGLQAMCLNSRGGCSISLAITLKRTICSPPRSITRVPPRYPTTRRLSYQIWATCTATYRFGNALTQPTEMLARPVAAPI